MTVLGVLETEPGGGAADASLRALAVAGALAASAGEDLAAAWFGPVGAVVISGAVWAVWHLPGYFIYGAASVPGFVFFALTTTASGGLLCWLRLRSRSVWPAAIWHAAYDNQGPAVAGLLTPLNLSAAQLTTDLMGPVLMVQLLATAFVFGFGAFVRAAREDAVVWRDQGAGRSTTKS